MDAERNFLFGLTALKQGLINARQLAEIGAEWMALGDRPLADLLADLGWISGEERSTVEASMLRDLEATTVPAPNGEAGSTSPAAGPVVFLSVGTTEAAGGSEVSTRELPDRNGDQCGDPYQSRVDGQPTFGPRYRVLGLHATGGIGRVWKVRDLPLGREIALKELRPDRPRTEYVERRFLEEARITAGLEHPNIVPAHDLISSGGDPFYTMKFLGQKTLKDVVLEHHRGKDKGRSSSSPTLRDLLESFLDVCNAIAFAHSKGVIHRDLKGQNVVLGEQGEAVVLDWGLARRLNDKTDLLARPSPGFALPEDSLTIDGFPIGTPNYMPPEQARGDREAIGVRSDVFGLGAILYLILTSRPPFEGGDSTQVVAKAREADFPRPSKVAPKVPRALEAICLKALAKEPADRYATAKDLAEEVRRWQADEPVKAYPDGALDSIARAARKNLPIVAGVGALLLTSVVGLGIGYWRLGLETRRVIEANLRTQSARGVALNDLRVVIDGIYSALETVQTDLPSVRDPAAERVRLKLADAGVAMATDLTSRHGDDPKVLVALGDLLALTAKVHRLAFHFDIAEKSTRKAVEILGTMEARRSLPPPARDALTGYTLDLVELLIEQDRRNEAGAFLDRASKTVAALRATVGNHPGVLRTESRVLLLRGDLLREQGDAGALTHYDDGIAKLRAVLASRVGGPYDALSIADAQISRGISARNAGHLSPSIATMTRAEASARLLLDADPGDYLPRMVVARAETELAKSVILRGGPGDDTEADRLLKDANDAFEGLAREHPEVLDLRRRQAEALLERGLVVAISGKGDEAERHWSARRVILNDLEALIPGSSRKRQDDTRIAVARVGLAINRGDAAEARRLLDEAESSLEPDAKTGPSHLEREATRTRIEFLRTRLSATNDKGSSRADDH